MLSLGLTSTRPQTNIPPPPVIPTPVTARTTFDEHSIRPRRFQDFVGQIRVVANLKVAVQAARNRGEALDHVLLTGGPGLGKTTIAQILANEMGSAIKISSGPLLERKIDLTGILLQLRPGDIFFLDEAHRLDPALEEILYPALEDHRLDLILDHRVRSLPLPHFTFVAATTKPNLISSPLRSRFGINESLDFYAPGDLLQIVLRSAKILGIGIDGPGAGEIARRSRGTPRVANRLLRRIRDHAQICGNGYVSQAIASEALQRLGIDSLGLEDTDRRLLHIIHRNGGCLGLQAIAAALSMDEGAITEIHEPYLLRVGLVARTPRGRAITMSGRKHLAALQQKEN